MYLTTVSSNGVSYNSIFQWCMLQEYITPVSSNGVSYMLQEYLPMVYLTPVSSNGVCYKSILPSWKSVLPQPLMRTASPVSTRPSECSTNDMQPASQTVNISTVCQHPHCSQHIQHPHCSQHIHPTPTLQAVNTSTAWQHSHCKQSTRQQPDNTHTANSNTSTAWQHPHCKQQCT